MMTGNFTKKVDSISLGVFAFVFAGEILSVKGYIGAAILLLSILIVKVDFKSLLKRN